MSYLRHALTRQAWWIAIVWLTIGGITGVQVVVGIAALGRRANWVSLFLATV